MTGSDILVRSLAEEGVEHVFGYPGGSVLYIYDAIYKQDKFKHILVRHEQAAVHAADAYARSSGKVGVALVTSGQESQMPLQVLQLLTWIPFRSY